MKFWCALGGNNYFFAIKRCASKLKVNRHDFTVLRETSLVLPNQIKFNELIKIWTYTSLNKGEFGVETDHAVSRLGVGNPHR